MSLSKNIIIYGTLNAIKSLIPFLLLPILTKYLSPDEYGTLSLIEVIILMLLPFIFLNIHGAVKVEYFRLSSHDLAEYISTAIVMSLISFGTIFTIIFIFSHKLSSYIDIPFEILILIPVFVFLRVLATLMITIYQVTDNAVTFMKFVLFQSLIDFVLSLVFITQLNYGYYGRIEAVYITFLLASAYSIYLLQSMNLLGNINLKKYFIDIVNFGVPLIPHALGAVIMNMSDRFFIAHYIGNEQVGIYTVSYQLSALMLLVGMSINQAWSPYLFKLLASKNYIKIIPYSIYIIIILIISLISIYLFSDTLFLIFIAEEFQEAKIFFPFLLLSFFFQSLYFIFVNFLFYEKKTYMVAKFTIVSSLINIILNYFFIQKYGTLGVAYATLFTWIIYFMLVALYTKKHWYIRLTQENINDI